MQEKNKDRLFNRFIGQKKGSFFYLIKQTFLFLVPVFIIGACALMIQSFPVTAVREFIATRWGGVLYELLDIIYTATYGFAAVYVVMVLSFFLASSYTEQSDLRICASVSSVICYFASLGPRVLHSADLLEYTKMANLFSALITAFVFTELFVALYRAFNSHSETHPTAYIRALRVIFPTLCCLVIASVISELLHLIPGVANFNDLVTFLLSKPFEAIGATYIGGLLIMLLESVLWIFGIHGGNTFDSLLTSETGAFAFGGGQIMTKAFTDTFVLLGGCGTALCLLIAVLLFSRDKKKKQLCRLSAVPTIFNINELLIFGIPIVLNPVYAIPFIITPLVSYTVAYLATLWGLVPQITNAAVQWTTPIFISGYQATGSIAGSILQLVLLVLGVAIYAPFVIIENRMARENETRYIETLTGVCRSCEQNGEKYALGDADIALRTFEDDLASKLSNDILGGNIGLRYQPQVKDGRIIAVESLLRFRYNDSCFIYPPLVVGIATNRELFDRLSRAIVRRALADLHDMQLCMPKLKLSVNLRLDLLMDDDFRAWIIERIKGADITPHTFGIEITEDADMSDSESYRTAFDEVKAAGAEILMDDFSMGHTSITMLQEKYFDYVKIDGGLIKALDNERSRNIVNSIVQLGDQLGFDVIAEYVETPEQRDALLGMGCTIFQGWLYYRDMPLPELLGVLRQQCGEWQ